MSKRNYNIRSDFADEMISRQVDEKTYQHIEKVWQDIKTNYIKILEDENVLGKDKGDYVSIEFQNIFDRDHRDMVVETVKQNLEIMMENMNLSPKKILVVGLGNRFITSDALGPGVANEIMVTAHLYANEDHDMLKGTGNVAVIQPGVMGQTGLESSAIVKSVCEEYQPDVVFVIDALATRNTGRINRVIQINNTGIRPGSGVGNHRHALNEEELHVPVIAIGVATVTSIGAILSEALDPLDDEKEEMLEQLAQKNHLDLVVTPKSMDDELKHLIYIVSTALNKFFHPAFDTL